MKNNSQEYYNERLKSLANFGKKINESSESIQRTLVDVERSNEGIAYGIIKESHKYIIKKSTSNKPDNQLNESDFVYINGSQNKTLYTYGQLAEAEKNRNMYIMSMNEAFSIKPTIDESAKEVIVESVKPMTDNPLGFLSSVISKNKSKINESTETKLKDSIQKHNGSFKNKSIIGEDVISSVRKTMNLLTEDVNTEDNVDTDINKALDALSNLEDKTSTEETAPITEPEVAEPNTEAPVENAPVEEPVIDTPEIPTDVTAEMPSEDVPTEETPIEDVPAEDTGDVPAEVPTEDNADDASLTKEIEKLVGKLTYNVRQAELSPEETNSFLKSILKSFESELAGLDVNQKKELSRKITDTEVPTEETPEVQTEGFDEESDDESQDEPCGECGDFDSYSKSMGYDSLDEASPIEKGYVISGYVDAYKGGKNDGDFKAISRHLSPEVVSELAEYGHDDYAKEAEFYQGQEEEGGDQELPCEGCGDVKESEEPIESFDSLSDDEKAELFQMYLEKKNSITESEENKSFAPNGQVLGVVSPNKGITESVDKKPSAGLSKEKKSEIDSKSINEGMMQPSGVKGDFVKLKDDSKMHKIKSVKGYKPPKSDFTYIYTFEDLGDDEFYTQEDIDNSSVNEAKLREFIRGVLDECASGKKSPINESTIKQSEKLQKVANYVKSKYSELSNKK